MYSPTRLYKRYFSTPELRECNFETYKRYFNSKHWPIQYRNAAAIFSSVRYNHPDAYHTFTKEQHFATWRYLEQEHPELFI